MKRRGFLATAVTGATGVLAGCLGSGGSEDTETTAMNGDYLPDSEPSDGLPPEFSDQPAPPDADPSSFETLTTNDETVRLVPIEVAQAWYYRREARFVDARGPSQYERSHIYGAVLSPAQQNSSGGGIEGWDTTDNIVTYCGCPHHLSSIRAAGLQKADYERVYALDEGFVAWSDNEYPMAGNAFGSEEQADVQAWQITGSVDDRYAGEYVWASASGQYEAAPIDPDGSYDLHLSFGSVSSETPVRLRTPDTTVERPLGDLGSRA